MRIMSLEGSMLCKGDAFTATKDGKPDPNAFRGILDESLDTLTDTMRAQASVKIDRKIGGTDAPMPEPTDEPPKAETSDVDEIFEPYTPKVRKSGTGCVYQINDHLWEGSFYPRLPDGKRKKFNVYAKTREECEEALAKMIIEKKAEIAEMKKKARTA